jgi:uncharacterized phiE125 gp8 family phage protein
VPKAALILPQGRHIFSPNEAMNMALYRIAEPAIEPVSVAEARAWMRIDHTSEDALIGELIRAARMDVENRIGLALISQTWRLTLDTWPKADCLTLPRAPVTAVLAVTLYDEAGNASLVSSSGYQLDAKSEPARLRFNSRPNALRRMNGIEIDFACGYGATPQQVPELMRRAIKVLVAHFYEFRGAFSPADQPVSLPNGYLPLIRPWLKVRV